MSKWMQHTIELIVACLVLIGVAVGYNTFQFTPTGHMTRHHMRFRTARQVELNESVPTLYVHGLQGSSQSTDQLINSAAKDSGRRAMVINVTRTGRLKCKGTIRSYMDHPLVQVNFLDSVAPVKRQVMWMHNILQLLKARYHINRYNAVAHSAGAVTVLETTDKYGNQRNFPHLSRFASIAGPYDGVIGMNDHPNQNKLRRNGEPKILKRGNRWYPGYEQLMKNSRQFPKGVRVLNVYGRINRKINADGYVTNASARSLKYLLRGRGDRYREAQIYGRYASHSGLHHNFIVDRIVNHFLFN